MKEKLEPEMEKEKEKISEERKTNSKIKLVKKTRTERT